MKIGGESSATCRGCATFSTRQMPKPRNLGRLRYIFRRRLHVQINITVTRHAGFIHTPLLRATGAAAETAAAADLTSDGAGRYAYAHARSRRAACDHQTRDQT